MKDDEWKDERDRKNGKKMNHKVEKYKQKEKITKDQRKTKTGKRGKYEWKKKTRWIQQTHEEE